MILITTTRRPSRRTRSLVRDLYHVLPNSKRRNRGKMSLEDLNELALREGIDRVIVVATQRGNPSSLMFYEPTPALLKPISVMKLNGVSLRREITEKRAPYSRKLCVAFSPEGLKREADVLGRSFNAPSFRSEINELALLKGSCDVAFFLSIEGGLKGSFYKVTPTEELGPRFRISEIREYDESTHEVEDRV